MRPTSLKSNIFIGFTLAILILIVSTFMLRNDIYQSLQDPGQPFQTYDKPTPPDYTTDYAWIARPDLALDPFEDPTLGDVFVVVPAIYRGGRHWNIPVDNERRRIQLQRVVRPNYVAPYGSAGRLFAPYYRQAALYTSMTAREDARRAQDLAYQDVRQSFEYFLEHSPPERPIVLAGHGQGGSHTQRLLVDYFNGPLKDRLAAAYIINHPLPLDKFEAELSHIAPCETETDTGCIIAFGAFMPSEDANARRFVTRLKVYDQTNNYQGDYHIVDGRPLLCVNPLLWNRSTDYAPNRLHKGGIAAEGIEPDMLPSPLVKQTGAQCQDGILYVDRPKSRALRRPIRLGGRYHTLPSNLFYEDLRINAEKRVIALINQGALPTRVEKLDDLDVIEIVDSPVVPIEK